MIVRNDIIEVAKKLNIVVVSASVVLCKKTDLKLLPESS